jgi:hypothetical protein
VVAPVLLVVRFGRVAPAAGGPETSRGPSRRYSSLLALLCRVCRPCLLLFHSVPQDEANGSRPSNFFTIRSPTVVSFILVAFIHSQLAFIHSQHGRRAFLDGFIDRCHRYTVVRGDEEDLTYFICSSWVVRMIEDKNLVCAFSGKSATGVSIPVKRWLEWPDPLKKEERPPS